MVKKTKRKRESIKTYACDFETNTENWLHDKDPKVNQRIKEENPELWYGREAWREFTKGDQAFVWSWGATEIRENMSFTGDLDNFVVGKTITEYVDWMLDGSKNVWFHNLKFDGSFIAVELLRRGYKFTFDRNPAMGEFTGLIDGKKMWFDVTVCKEGPRGGRQFINIKDSLKKVPMGLRACAFAFGLDVFKDDLDYDQIRYPYEPISEADFKYLKKDVEITAKIIHYQVFQSNLKKTTIGSDALNEFKTTVGGDKGFKDWFPVLDFKTDSFIRKSYFGGITQVKPGYEGKLIGEGMVFDIVSMYPWVQYTKLLPYGMPVPYEGKYEYDEEYPLYIQKVSFSFYLKDDHLPTIQLKKQNVEFNYNEADDVRKFNGREFQKTSYGEIVTMYLTSVQWEQVQKHYLLDDVTFHEGYMFKGMVGIFKEHIDKWIKVKKDANDSGNSALKSLAKLMLNSPYGKFGTNTIKLNVEPFLWDDDGSLGFKIEDEDPPPGDPIYTAYASFVTAYAREELMNVAMSCYDRFRYCDTDSVHIEGNGIPESIKHRIGGNLGDWEPESEFKMAKFHRAKTYCEMIYAKKVMKKDRWGDMAETIKHIGKVEWEALPEEQRTLDKNLKCAGMQKSIADKVDFDEFEIGLCVDPHNPAKPKWRNVGKLMPSQVPGGTLLRLRKFSLN
ncbi:DNA polymerase [Bacillus phage DK2]|uniref:DNA-directed DNA polymerase n=1 Tax=Bacillus phage DK2 TaxID=2500809 RepID=A0A3T0IIZ6_9CAUD|nr:DNA polymerase [Bacillus phage DK2]AZU99770.1 DNA polymerase [Bacillus phage DK2]